MPARLHMRYRRPAPARRRFCGYFPPGPAAFSDEDLRRLTAPVLLTASEWDVFGHGQATVGRARAVWPQAETVLMAGSRHVPSEARWQEALERVGATSLPPSAASSAVDEVFYSLLFWCTIVLGCRSVTYRRGGGSARMNRGAIVCAAREKGAGLRGRIVGTKRPAIPNYSGRPDRTEGQKGLSPRHACKQ